MSVLNLHSDVPDEINQLSKSLVDAVFCVHKELGPGYLEKVYEEAVVFELNRRQIPFVRQHPLRVLYRGSELPCDFRLDLVVDDKIVVELKAVEKVLPVHEAQIISYLKQSGLVLGFLVNFNQTLIKDGIHRIVCSDNLRNFASSR